MPKHFGTRSGRNIAKWPPTPTELTTSTPADRLPHAWDTSLRWWTHCRTQPWFAGVANPLSLRPLSKGERVVDVGSGAGFDCFVAAHHVGSFGHVVGVDMTEEMLSKARQTATSIGFDHVEFKAGLAEDLPIASGWADVVISNGVINLCADKRMVFREIHRVLRPGGHLEFADIANGRPVPEAAVQKVDLWTA